MNNSLIKLPALAIASLFIFLFMATKIMAISPPMPFTVNGKAIITASNDQAVGTITRFGSDLFIAWQDDRNLANKDIYAQKINVFNGEASWDAQGNQVSDLTGSQLSPVLVTDGSGGLITNFVSLGAGNFDVYAQKMNSSGVRQWGTSGIGVASGTADQRNTRAISDGQGGAIISWNERPGVGSSYDVHVQRVTSGGALAWPSPVVVSAAVSDQQNQEMVVDGQGGAVIVWNDRRSLTDWDIYGQRIASDGAVQWTADGKALAAIAASDQVNPRIMNDPSGNYYVGWYDTRTAGTNNAASRDIYIQRFDGSGNAIWGSDTVVRTVDQQITSSERRLRLATSDSSDIYAVWTDSRNNSYADLYAQKIASSGAVGWTSDGIEVATADYNQSAHEIVPDGIGGVVAVWGDDRFKLSSREQDIYTQRLMSSGEAYWDVGGVPVTSEDGLQDLPNITDDGAEGAVVVWFDDRNAGTTQTDIYAQRVDPDQDGDLVGDTTDNCPTVYNPYQADANTNNIGDACESGNTPAGNNIAIDLGDSASITFSQISGGGITSISSTDTAPQSAVSGFNFLGTYYDIVTSATYSGLINVCFPYLESEVPDPEQSLKLFHLVNGVWETVPSNVYTDTNIICGQVISLSYFGMGYPTELPSTGRNALFSITMAFGFILIGFSLLIVRLRNRFNVDATR